MKFALYSFLCTLLAALALAVAPENQIIVSYPENTPDRVLEAAKDAIIQAGGIITHEYSLIKGFAAKTTEKIAQSIEALGAEYNVLVEQDSTVGIA